MIWMLAILVLHPVLEDDGALRLVSDGTGDRDVAWRLDGELVATTWDGEPASIQVEAGRHELRASSEETGAWQIMARPDPPGPGARYVPAWTARAEAMPVDDSRASWPWWLVVPAAALIIAPRWRARRQAIETTTAHPAPAVPAARTARRRLRPPP